MSSFLWSITCGGNRPRCEIIQCNRSRSKPIIVLESPCSANSTANMVLFENRNDRVPLKHSQQKTFVAARKASQMWCRTQVQPCVVVDGAQVCLPRLDPRSKLSHLEISTITPVTLKLRGERPLISERSSRTVWCGTHVDRWL